MDADEYFFHFKLQHESTMVKWIWLELKKKEGWYIFFTLAARSTQIVARLVSGEVDLEIRESHWLWRMN